MAGQAKSDLAKHLAAKRLHNAWMLWAISAYCLEQGKKCSKSSPTGVFAAFVLNYKIYAFWRQATMLNSAI